MPPQNNEMNKQTQLNITKIYMAIVVIQILQYQNSKKQGVELPRGL